MDEDYECMMDDKKETRGQSYTLTTFHFRVSQTLSTEPVTLRLTRSFQHVRLLNPSSRKRRITEGVARRVGVEVASFGRINIKIAYFDQPIVNIKPRNSEKAVQKLLSSSSSSALSRYRRTLLVVKYNSYPHVE